MLKEPWKVRRRGGSPRNANCWGWEGRKEGEKALTLIRFERIQDESSPCVLRRKEPEQLMLRFRLNQLQVPWGLTR